jgi:hypothetical protein
VTSRGGCAISMMRASAGPPAHPLALVGVVGADGLVDFDLNVRLSAIRGWP